MNMYHLVSQTIVHAIDGDLVEVGCNEGQSDGDFYDSIMVSLKYVYPRLPKGAVCLIDDYCDPDVNPGGWNYLPGVKKACDEFMADKPERIVYLYSGAFTHAFFWKE